ncbi:30S ribosome-binding factor RbfA [Rhodoblastus acidophilus]|uniref:Ribosome-binding factor A n=1 Tax=Candidatus Rhodoblastus alkanivorans TaxID=2954117 RepID=A0ABS9ZAS5_9HYPH|nr:30S ribosome-binding factor RbfA [Candidatus Rhodoblastus alkanivorans]MCI4680061.1 30S ribosome-binding factor RbfA [Candidatus Rhodoblastus alkanivorans]MCI4684809.1 30S ribosome-binding factor RbfA [Candidatus Rhodoblastus alkanivorans]MDI4642133.1 30S ribosome-binding factor RbfA [Rhodoblastus acidophilus]
MSRLHQKGGEPSQRMLRVAELIRHAMAQLLSRGEINDPDLAGLVVTIPSVRMSPDLKLATIYVMPLGGAAQEQIVAILDRHKKFLRGEIAHHVNLKYAPEIRFKVDESFANAEKIDALLHSPKVAQDLTAPAQDDDQDNGDGN